MLGCGVGATDGNNEKKSTDTAQPEPRTHKEPSTQTQDTNGSPKAAGKRMQERTLQSFCACFFHGFFCAVLGSAPSQTPAVSRLDTDPVVTTLVLLTAQASTPVNKWR